MLRRTTIYIDNEFTEALSKITVAIRKPGVADTMNGSIRYAVLKMAREIAANSPISP